MNYSIPRQTVYLHVGAPKTGTTFLQEILFGHREALESDGILYPVDGRVEHFLPAVDLRNLAFYGEHFLEAKGTWRRVADRANTWPGITIISHDVFAGASADEARRAIEALDPADVHVVYTARDLARQLPSQWQEDVKHGRMIGFDQWLYEVLEHAPGSEAADWFWGAHDITDVLTRWGSSLSPKNVHIVTVPHPGAAPLTLWKRFASVIGVAFEKYDTSVVRHINKSLGAVEVELLRRVNRILSGKISQAHYGPMVKERFAHQILEKRANTVPIVLPRRHFERVTRISSRWIEILRTRGYDIVGDVEELHPRVRDEVDERRHPGDVSDRQFAEVGAEMIAQLLIGSDTTS